MNFISFSSQGKKKLCLIKFYAKKNLKKNISEVGKKTTFVITGD